MKKALICILCLLGTMSLAQQENIEKIDIETLIKIPAEKQPEIQKEYQVVKKFNRVLERIKKEKIAQELAAKVAAEKKVVAEKKAKETTTQKGNIVFKLSFYTALPEENGGHGLMANGEPVATTTNAVASNYYPLGTKIYLEGWGTFTVKDRGGKNFDSPNRLDVLILKKSGESNSAYKQRVMNLGRQTTTGSVKLP